MSWMDLFETLVNGSSILDCCRQELGPRGCKDPGSDPKNKRGNNLFIYLI